MNQKISRRQWMLASTTMGLAACGRSKGTGYYGYALVANAGDNSLAVIDLAAFRLAANINLFATPSHVITAPGGAPAYQAYVLTPANGTIHRIDGHLTRAKSRRIADQLSHLSLAGNAQSLLAWSPGGNELIRADLTTLNPLARYKFSVTADAIDFSSTGYVAVASDSGSVELLHLASGRRTRTQTPRLGKIRFRADGKVLLAANLQNRSLLILDVPALQVIVELPLAMQPDHLCFNADQGQLFVSGAGMDGVAVVFPYDTMQVDQTLLAGRDPGTMACSDDPGYLFVASSTGSDVCILNIDTRKVIGFVEIGGRPSFITITPDSQYALILDQFAGDMGVVHIPAIKIRGDAGRLKTGAALFTMLSVGSNPVDAVVIPKVV